METNKHYIPSKPVHPFDILRDELAARGISHKDFALRLGMKASNFSRMLKEKGNVDARLALDLERETGIPCDEWLGLYTEYLRDMEEVPARDKIRDEAALTERKLSGMINLRGFYSRLGLTHKDVTERVQALDPYAKYIQNPGTFITAGRFKKSNTLGCDDIDMFTWVLLALISAEKAVEGFDYQEGNAEKAAREIASEANKQTLTTASIENILTRYGIGYRHVEKLGRAPVDAYSVMSGRNPAIIATYRINDMDKLAFDILHELGHITLHLEKGYGTAFIKVDGDISENRYEKEADQFAQDNLIPPELWDKIMNISRTKINPWSDIETIAKRAAKMGISKSIAVSRYKHDTLFYKTNQYHSPKIR